MTLDPDSYGALLATLKTQVRSARLRAQLAVNAELLALYWRIGSAILQAQAEEGWGAKVIPRLAADLKQEFPDMTGLSRTNLLYMRAFAEAWPDWENVQQTVGQLPWGRNLTLLDRLKTSEERLWYALAAREHGCPCHPDRHSAEESAGSGRHQHPADVAGPAVRSGP
jgi:predicted nuclease of restriction endonuclease-like (RecB) superfamily